MDIVGKGICRLSVIPVRSEPSHRAEMSTQLLFGEHYTVIGSLENEWIKIQNYHDKYEGWLPIQQYSQISDEYFEQINDSDYKISTDISTTILFNKNKLNILIGSIIPIATNEIFHMEEKLAFNGESKSLRQRRDAEYIIQVAKKLLNTPYLWGGRTPFGIDCSGFTQLIFRIGGYLLPRDSSYQATIGTPVDKIEDMLPGDLVFFNNEEGKTYHVGLFLGEDKIIHASGRVRTDFITEEGIKMRDTSLFSHRNPFIKRIIS